MNPASIEIEPTRHGYSWPGVERRDLLKHEHDGVAGQRL
jgi:hypothetical protein